MSVPGAGPRPAGWRGTWLGAWRPTVHGAAGGGGGAPVPREGGQVHALHMLHHLLLLCAPVGAGGAVEHHPCPHHPALHLLHPVMLFLHTFLLVLLLTCLLLFLLNNTIFSLLFKTQAFILLITQVLRSFRCEEE